ncbi:MAG: hypothetical protein H6R19_1052 [Proteobacteria bacterium]|nr:hypothetical protein [Pseudomonadota bacterium]
MISGHISCLEKGRIELPKTIFSALQTLRELDFSMLEDGVIATPHTDMKFTLFHARTMLASDNKPETHSLNIDIHYLISGAESQGYQPLSEHLRVMKCDDSQDIRFYENQPHRQSMITLGAGGFSVYFPWDVHMPLCAVGLPDEVRKVVVKVPVHLF